MKSQQARDFAAAQHVFIQRDRLSVLDDGQFFISHAKFICHQRHRGGFGAQDQRLAARQKDTHRAVVGGNRGGLHKLVQVAHQLVALVQQVVGRLPVALRADNLLIHAGNAFGQTVDVVNLDVELLRDAELQFVQALGRRPHAGRRFIHPGQHDRTGGQVRGGAGHVGKRVQHVVHRGAQAAGATGKNVLQLLELVDPGAVGGGGGAGQRRLACQVGAEIALNRGDLNALANVATARELAQHGLLHHALARVAGRVDIGNVVARGLQGHLVGLQRTGADVKNAAHRFCATTLARCRRCVLSMARLSLAAYWGSVA